MKIVRPGTNKDFDVQIIITYTYRKQTLERTRFNHSVTHVYECSQFTVTNCDVNVPIKGD